MIARLVQEVVFPWVRGTKTLPWKAKMSSRENSPMGFEENVPFSKSKRNKVGAGFSRILNSSPAISGCSYD